MLVNLLHGPMVIPVAGVAWHLFQVCVEQREDVENAVEKNTSLRRAGQLQGWFESSQFITPLPFSQFSL